MRVVADTNVLVSALLWSGLPHRLLAIAEAGHLTLYTSPVLIQELAGVLSRQKFASRLDALRVSVEELIAGYVRLAHVILPQPMAPVILEDPEDDAVLACALAARAEYVISGDGHLLSLTHYRSIHLVSTRTFLATVLRIRV